MPKIVIRSRDVIGHVTIRFSIGDFLYVLKSKIKTVYRIVFVIFSVRNYDVLTSGATRVQESEETSYGPARMCLVDLK